MHLMRRIRLYHYKQLNMIETILYLYDRASRFIEKGKALSLILGKTDLFDQVIQMKYDIGNEPTEQFDALKHQIDQTN